MSHRSPLSTRPTPDADGETEEISPSPSAPSPSLDETTIEPPDDEKDKGLGLSLTQIVGGALAAMTAAFLGSRMSLAGTVVGAAAASIIAAVAGSLYTASLRRTRDKVRSVWGGQASAVPTTIDTVPHWEPAAGAPTQVTGVPTAVAGVPAAVGGVPAAVSPRSPGTRLVETEPTDPRQRSRVRRLVVRIVLGAVAIFGVAVLSLTLLELVAGQPLSGGDGTTISNVQAPAPERASSPTEEATAPADSPSAEPSATPEPSAGAEPTQTPSAPASETPTAEPSTSSPPSSTPTPSTGTAGDQAGTVEGAGGS